MFRFHANGSAKDMADNYLAYMSTVWQEVSEKYKDQLAEAGFLERIRLRIRMQREISKAQRERFGLWNLYFRK